MEMDTRVTILEQRKLPEIQTKLKYVEELGHINQNRVENSEIKIGALEKSLLNRNDNEIDLGYFDNIENLMQKLETNIDTVKNDMTEALKEVRDVLLSKADDESITGKIIFACFMILKSLIELENKIVLKLNELVENICK